MRSPFGETVLRNSAAVFSSFANKSVASVNASTTVGTPIPITGIPIVFLSRHKRLLPTPAPGEIPLSLICIVQPRRERLLDASLSQNSRRNNRNRTQSVKSG